MSSDLLTRLLTNSLAAEAPRRDGTRRSASGGRTPTGLAGQAGMSRHGIQRTRKPLSVVRRIEGSNPSPSAISADFCAVCRKNGTTQEVGPTRGEA